MSDQSIPEDVPEETEAYLRRFHYRLGPEDLRGMERFEQLLREHPPNDVGGERRCHRRAAGPTESISAFHKTGGCRTDGVAPLTRALSATVAFAAAK